MLHVLVVCEEAKNDTSKSYAIFTETVREKISNNEKIEAQMIAVDKHAIEASLNALIGFGLATVLEIAIDNFSSLISLK